MTPARPRILFVTGKLAEPALRRVLADLAPKAGFEPHVEVRSQLACTAKRLPAADALPVVRGLLARDEDTEDIHVPLLVWWAIDRSRFGMGLKAIREDEDKAQSLGVPTFKYKLVVFVISAFFTALAGGMYALWFGYLDPIFQFSILIGSYMVLMSLLGGIRSLFGPVLGAVVVGYALEYFKAAYGDTQFHLVALGLLLALVVLFMPDGILPALGSLVRRFSPQATSIREMTAAELLERNRGMDGNDTTRTPAPATPASDPAHEPDSTADDLSRERTEAHR